MIPQQNLAALTSEEFIRLGQELTGKKRGYQKPLAEKLKIRVLTVKRYASGHSKVPEPIAELLRVLILLEHPYINYSF